MENKEENEIIGMGTHIKKDFLVVIILTVIILTSIIVLFIFDKNSAFSTNISEKIFDFIMK